MKLNLGQDSEVRFSQYFEFEVQSRCLGEILKLILGRYSEDEICSRFMFELVLRPKKVTLVS